jgi:hypothetical protein
MNYIKSFKKKTERKLKYNVGDYVLLDMLDEFDYDDCAGEIIASKSNNSTYYTLFYDYRVQFFDMSHFDCEEMTILRKLTKKEIEDYHTKKAALKYNI